MSALAREVLARLPLADAVLHVWSFLAEEGFLHDLYQTHRGRCYEHLITFPMIVQLVASALLEHEGCGRASFEQAQEDQTLPTSVWAAFQKLGHMPLAVSEAFLRVGTQRLLQILPEHDYVTEVPASLRGFEIVLLDGKAIKRVAKRLKPLWGVAGGLLGGRALVAMHFRRGVVLAMASHEDGDANDARFMPQLLEQVRGVLPGTRLYVGDRQYCNLVQAERFTQAGDHFLVRYHRKNSFTLDEQFVPREGTDAQGRRYVESWGWLGSATQPQRRLVRRIVLERPGEEALILVTDLLDAEQYPALDLLALYRQRWTIERVFQQVTEVFHLQQLIGTRPKATVFQFAFCLQLYNLIQVIRTYLAQSQARPVESISSEKLFEDVTDELIAWSKVSTPEETLAVVTPLPTPAHLKRYLARRLRPVWRERWVKARPKKPRAPLARAQGRTHQSVYRILEDHRQAQLQKLKKPRADKRQRPTSPRC